MKKTILFFLFTIGLSYSYSQTNSISIKANLNPATKEIYIIQKTTFFNTSKDTLSEVYFHNWANAYRDKKTPLAKRFTEDYKKAFHFAKEKDRGHSKINSIVINTKNTEWVINNKNPDILKVILPAKLNPSESIEIKANYTVKLPRNKFTKYGYENNHYYLKYWYLTPAIYKSKWHTYNNLNLNDLYVAYSNYNIEFTVPKSYIIVSDLISASKVSENKKTYFLIGKKHKDVELNINPKINYNTLQTEKTTVITNILESKLSNKEKTVILKRSLTFLEEYLGKLPQKIMLSKTNFDKDPVYGLNLLPKQLSPFSPNFEFDIKTFKILSKEIINSKLLFNQREDAWLANGLQTYLMIKYVEKYYPSKKALGKIANIWGIKKFYISKLNFNQKYPYLYQFSARKDIEQPLITRADSLSNFNRKINHKYKAGIGLNYLDLYLENIKFKSFINRFLTSNQKKIVSSNFFLNNLEKEAYKNINWFKNDYLKTNKTTDYSIKKVFSKRDSLKIIVKNKGKLAAPTILYGFKNNTVVFKKWIDSIKNTDTITIKNNHFDKVALNYEGNLPEADLKNNWKNIHQKLLNKPISLKLIRDMEDPYHNQIFLTPIAKYNYYNGLVLGSAIGNKTLLPKKFIYKVTPSFGTKSKTLAGSYSFYYQHYPKNEKVKRFSFGVLGSHYQYDKNLDYNVVQPYAILEFKKKNYRSPANKAIALSYTVVNKENSPTQKLHKETNKYNVLDLSFGYSNPAIIKDIRFSTNLQIANKFSKASVTARYRKLTHNNSQLDFRFFAGTFFYNKTQSNYFNFALNRPSDYLFQYDYLGRSETSGFFSQQVIITEGGFKSKFPTSHANQWITTFNTSIGIWKWIGIYNDFGLLKNKKQSPYFAYENGVHFNFIQDVLELYFPVYVNHKWQINQPKYAQKIRFVLTIDPIKIFNFLKRGFY